MYFILVIGNYYPMEFSIIPIELNQRYSDKPQYGVHLCDPLNSIKIDGIIVDQLINNICPSIINKHIQYRTISINGIKKYHMYKIPFYCYIEESTYEYLITTLKQYIGSQTADVYVSVELITTTDNYNIYSLHFFSDDDDRYAQYDDKIEFINYFMQNVDDKILKERYDNCNVIKDYPKAKLLEKPEFNMIDSVAYLWDEKQIKTLEFDENKNIIFNKNKFEQSFTFPTLHTYSYHGFFKPSLKEVFLQFPLGFEDNDPFLITTDLMPGDCDDIIQGRYHIGITTIYTKVLENQNKKHRTDKN